MEEQKDKDVPVGSGSEPTVSASGHVAGETLAGSEACVSEGQVEGAFTGDVGDDGLVEGAFTGDGAVDEDGQIKGVFTGDVGEDEGGSCNGDALMVEVLGSDVYVGGVCTSGDGENSDENEMGADALVEVDTGLEDARPLVEDGVEVGEPDSMATIVVNSTGGDTQVLPEEKAEADAKEAVNSQEVNVSEENAEDSTGENGIGGSLGGSTGSETQVVETQVVETQVVETQVVETQVVETQVVETQVVETQAVNVSEENAKDSTGENGIGGSLGGSTGSETQFVETQVVETQVETQIIETQIVETQVVEKEVVLVETAKIDENSSHSVEEHLEVGSTGSETQVVEKEVVVVETAKIDEKSSHSVEEHLLKMEPVGGSTHGSSHVLAHSVSSSLSGLVAPVGEIAVIGASDLLNSEKDQFLKPEESLENMVHDIALVSTTLPLSTQVVPGGVVSVTDGETLLNSERDQLLKPEDNMDENAGPDVPQVNSNTGQEMEVDKQVSDAEQVGLDGGHGIGLVSNSDVPEPAERDEPLNFEMSLEKTATDYVAPDRSNMETEEVKEQVTDAELDGLHGGQYMEVEKEATDSEQPKASEEEIVLQEAMQPGSSEIVPQPRYELPPENEGVYSVSDLVWGKVKSHPWWPGQIFDYTAASEKAMKYHKKDCFLVAYFGDRTFAWNEPSSLKPFQSYFSQSDKQCNSEAFQNAVNCALEEVSRRVELGLACSCTPKDIYEKIRFQTVENAGICQESSVRDGVDESARASSLECNKLLDYIKALAQFPSGDSDRLELVIAKAHLLAFNRLKGYCSLPEFQFCGSLLENYTDNSLPEHTTPFGKDEKGTFSGPEVITYSHKRKHNLRDGVYSKIKEKSLSELMGVDIDSPDGDDWLDRKDTGGLVSPSGKRRKGFEYHADDLAGQDGRKSVTGGKVSNTTPAPKQSFKIGECIQRVASQLTGSTIVKSNSDRPAGDGSDVAFQSSGDAHRGRPIDPKEYSSLDGLLSQLQVAAEGPQKEFPLLNTIVSFFSDFRNSVAVGQHPGIELSAAGKVGGGKRRRSSNSVLGMPETFEFDDMNDTYWTDRIIQNGAEEQASRRGRKPNYQAVVLAQPEKSPQGARRPYSRKRYSQGNLDLPAEKPVGYVDENAPAELVMNFSEVKSVPSEAKLNIMFRRFGPLRESETEVDRESSRARVVFKKCSDAEVACNSAGKFNIFGPIVVNYQLNYTLSQLNYTPSIQFTASPGIATQDQEMQLLLPSHDHEMHLDLSTHDQMHLDLSTHDQMQPYLSTHDQMQLDLSTHDQLQLDLSTFENLV